MISSYHCTHSLITKRKTRKNESKSLLYSAYFRVSPFLFYDHTPTDIYKFPFVSHWLQQLVDANGGNHCLRKIHAMFSVSDQAKRCLWASSVIKSTVIQAAAVTSRRRRHACTETKPTRIDANDFHCSIIPCRYTTLWAAVLAVICETTA